MMCMAAATASEIIVQERQPVCGDKIIKFSVAVNNLYVVELFKKVECTNERWDGWALERDYLNAQRHLPEL